MNKFIKLFFFIHIFFRWSSLGYAQNIEQNLQLSASAGHQQEDFRWSIAGNSNGQSPNILSELKWKNVSGTSYSVAMQYNIWRRFSVYADYNHVTVRSGSVSDMDYQGNNRTPATYQETFSDNKGYTTSWSAGGGYIIFNNKLFSLIPYVGYGTSAQYLYLVDLTGQFPGLNSSYFTNWKGLFVKVTSSLKVWRDLKIAVNLTYNQVNYSAQGDWNLIEEFQHPVSYRHTADGYGLNANARLIYNITHNIAVSFGYSYYDWETGNGTDLLYLTSGTVDKTQLNGVVRNGFQLNGGVVLSL